MVASHVSRNAPHNGTLGAPLCQRRTGGASTQGSRKGDHNNSSVHVHPPVKEPVNLLDYALCARDGCQLTLEEIVSIGFACRWSLSPQQGADPWILPPGWLS